MSDFTGSPGFCSKSRGFFFHIPKMWRNFWFSDGSNSATHHIIFLVVIFNSVQKIPFVASPARWFRCRKSAPGRSGKIDSADAPWDMSLFHKIETSIVHFSADCNGFRRKPEEKMSPELLPGTWDYGISRMTFQLRAGRWSVARSPSTRSPVTVVG